MSEKYIIGLVLSIATLSVLQSQIKFKAGVNVGGQFSSLRGFDFEPNENFQLGPTVGVYLELGLNSKISIVTGINFERWKLKRDIAYYDGYGRNIGIENTEGYDFYNIPLLFRYKFGKNNDFFVEGGAFMNYFNKGRPNGVMSLFIVFEDYNFGPALGVGKIFTLNDKFDVALQLRNEFGLTNVNKYETWVSGNNILSNTIRLTASFSYTL
jgi:hypothetical protein